jgi:dTDP-glucose pyrophosphorylase
VNERLRSCCVTPTATIRETLAAIDAGSVEIAIVVAEDDRVIGTISDGDVRRALLGGASLDDEVLTFVQRQFTWVAPGSGRADVLDLMRARFVSQVPVLDPDGRLVGLHVMREILGVAERRNAAVVMAGGRGTRLAPLTEHLPKPMMRVAGRPILERIVLHLVGYGVPVIYLAVNYMADVITDHFGDGTRFGCEIRYLAEDPTRPLGSAGALGLLPPDELARPTPLLVLNGDLVTQFDVDRLLRAHEEGGYAATVGVRKYSHDVPFGVLELRDGRVEALHEKPRHIWDVNAGVYVLDPRLVERVPRDREFMMTELLGACLHAGDPVGAYLLEGDWVDVGHLDALRRARGEAR